MSKDAAMGRLIRLAEKCNERSIVRLCNELEDVMEVGPYGVYTLGETVSITAGAGDEAIIDPVAVRESALQLTACGL